jgi:hypothetical protein
MKWDKDKAIFEKAAIVRVPGPHTPIEKASLQAARLIEAAMASCGADDLKALDCLMEARRAMSPIVDRRCPPAKPGADTAAH